MYQQTRLASEWLIFFFFRIQMVNNIFCTEERKHIKILMIRIRYDIDQVSLPKFIDINFPFPRKFGKVSRRNKFYWFVSFQLPRSRRNRQNFSTRVLIPGWVKSFAIFWKILQHNSAAMNAFVEVVKETNHTILWDAKLAWYSLSAACHICRSGLETLPDRWGSWEPKENFWTLCLLQWDQLRIHLSHNKCFCFFPLCYGAVWTHISKVSEFDNAALSSEQFSNHTHS